MESQIHADFGMRYKPEADFQQIIGGEVVRANEGCGPILSGESIYFSKVSVTQRISSTKNVKQTFISEDINCIVQQLYLFYSIN